MCELIIKQIAISCQLSKHKLKVPFTKIDEIKKKFTWGPPVSHFSYFLVNQLQDQPFFKKKKIDRGSPKEGFFRDILSPPPPQKKGQKTPISTPPPILQGTDHAIDNFIL